MKGILSYIRKAGAVIPMLALGCAAFVNASCDKVIYDYEGDCSVNYRVKFCYDYNMKYADAFAHEVSCVTLYLLDESGSVVWSKTEEGEALKQEGYAMSVDVNPGKYSLLAWCGTKDKNSFEIPSVTDAHQLTATLNRSHNAAGGAEVTEELDRLFHGWLPDQKFGEEEGTHYYTVPLIKNTNTIRVALQQLSGEPVDPSRFEFKITDNNGKIDWDNALMQDETLSYYAWHVGSGVADMNSPYHPETASLHGSSFSTALAEFTVSRLVPNHDSANPKYPILTIVDKEKRDSGKDEANGVLVRLPLVECLLLVKGEGNKAMSDQEYLDRQDEYNLIFFLDEGMRWIDSYIIINSWKVVFQHTEI